MTLKTSAGILLGLTLALGVRAAEMERPNILWLTSEDNSAEWLGCYGNPLAKTPNIDRLANEGFRYTHAFANIPVCSPTRGSWITGIHALSLGIQPMRSRNEIPHDRIPYYPDLLQARGYYTGNSTKTDYNIGGREDRDSSRQGQMGRTAEASTVLSGRQHHGLTRKSRPGKRREHAVQSGRRRPGQVPS